MDVVYRESRLIRTKSALDPKRPEDGFRLLIEPTWPRGLPKGKAAGVSTMRGLYPSPQLQDWMRRNPRKGEAFRSRYVAELARNEAVVDEVRRLHEEFGTVTILTVPVDGPWDIHETLAAYLRAVCE